LPILVNLVYSVIFFYLIWQNKMVVVVFFSETKTLELSSDCFWLIFKVQETGAIFFLGL